MDLITELYNPHIDIINFVELDTLNCLTMVMEDARTSTHSIVKLYFITQNKQTFNDLRGTKKA